MKIKLKWRFQKRGWPSADFKNGMSAAFIQCGDEYNPSRIKSGDHIELKVMVASYYQPSGFTWHKVKGVFSTVKDVKEAVKSFYKNHPEHLPKEIKEMAGI